MLAAPALVLSKTPDAKKILDKITPYQGWIGLVFCAVGIWNTISVLLGMSLFTLAPLWFLTWLAAIILQAVLGFILGYRLISEHALSKNADAKKK
jgi:hypothetical protein